MTVATTKGSHYCLFQARFMFMLSFLESGVISSNVVARNKVDLLHTGWH